MESIIAGIQRNRIKAEFDGLVVEWDESVRDGTPVAANQRLGRLVGPAQPVVHCYVRHDVVSNVMVDQDLEFCSNDGGYRFSGVVTNVDPVRTRFLGHRGLTSLASGDIAVSEDEYGRLELNDTYYNVEIALGASAYSPRLGQTGDVWVKTAPRSRAADLIRGIYRVLVEESNF